MQEQRKHGLESTIVAVSEKSIKMMRRARLLPSKLSKFAKVNVVTSPARRISAAGQLGRTMRRRRRCAD